LRHTAAAKMAEGGVSEATMLSGSHEPKPEPS
jgi:hypothetical protein